MYAYCGACTEVRIADVTRGVKRIHILIHHTQTAADVEDIFDNAMRSGIDLTGVQLVVHIENGPNVSAAPETWILLSIINRLHTIKLAMNATHIVVVIVQCNRVDDTTRRSLLAVSKMWNGTPVRLVEGKDAAVRKMVKWLAKSGCDVSAQSLA